MSKLGQLKLDAFNTLRKATSRDVSRQLSGLAASTDKAMAQQCYMHKNPDENGADELRPIATPEFLALSVAFNVVAGKLGDMQALQSGAMDVDVFISKYSIDLEALSLELI